MRTKPFLSIVSAVYDDFHGFYFTYKSLKLHHPQLLPFTEFVIVDQRPDSNAGKEMKSQLLGYDRSGLWGVNYIPYTERMGTAHSRALAIKEAKGDVRLCLDSHVILPAGSIWNLALYFHQRPDCKDIVSGPLLTDAIYDYRHLPPNVELDFDELLKAPTPRYSVMATHYAHHMREEMLGTWATAFQCPCGQFNFAPWKEGSMARWETVKMNPQFVRACPACGKRLPLLEWDSHEPSLENAGYKNLGVSEAPFEIPGMGLGMFAMREGAFPGFHPDAWGFGGEELYVHEKVRRNGGKAICLPTAPWLHRFPRPESNGGSPYPSNQWYKARNYVLEYTELGEKDPKTWNLQDLRRHFVSERNMPADEWDVLVSDPLKHIHGPTEKHVQPVMVNGAPRGNVRLDVQDLFLKYRAAPRDLNEHFPLLLEFGVQCSHITEFTKRRESTVIWLTSAAKQIVSYNLEAGDEVVRVCQALAQRDKVTDLKVEQKSSTEVPAIEETDLLFLDTVHHADRLRGELGKYGGQVRRFIVVRGTGAFGYVAEGGGDGMFAALREWVELRSDWRVVFHTNAQYGITILSRNPVDYPETPIVPWPPGFGPGTELKAILRDVGITNQPGCDCNQKAEVMDRWGVSGCKDNYAQIVKWMREGAERWGWKGVFIAGAKSVLNGLAFRVNPLDPYPGLVQEAIRRAGVVEKELTERRAMRERQQGASLESFDHTGDPETERGAQ